MTTISHQTPNGAPDFLPSAPTLRSLPIGGEFANEDVFTTETQGTLRWRRGLLAGVLEGVQRRWARERRRRKVGRAYDMALEIARVIPRGSEVLDVGCGNGFIAHHLSALLGTSIVGIDLGNSAEA